jgi:hypothetical protein
VPDIRKHPFSWVRQKFGTLLESEGFVPTLVTPEEREQQQQLARIRSPERMV